MYTKEQQLKKNKQPKRSNKNKPKITQEESKYLTYLASIRFKTKCFVCGTTGVEWHHVKLKSTDRKNHTCLIPLCFLHHHGSEISPHGTPSKWRQTYTMEEQEETARMYYRVYKNETK